MRGEWNGLKALILNDCPYAYYVHCMAHHLQLALVAASREVHDVHNFFQNANFIINVVSASTKRNDELLANKSAEIAREIELGELDTGKGQNQIGTLQRPGGDAVGAIKIIMSFDFVFILHLMEKIMKITDVLCQTLQKKSLDILNALDLVSTTKVLLGKLREDGWDPLLQEVQSFCLKHEIDIPDLNSRYVDVTKSRNKHDNTTTLHHYKADVFNVAIDQQMVELNDRFGVQNTELLTLCASLDPRHDSFDVSNICTLVEKNYPADFSSQERAHLESQLPHFQLDVCNHPELKSSPSLADLTIGLFKTGKAATYSMVDRLLRLVITLPVSTATTERAFSAMKLVKTRLRNRMGDDFLRHYMVVYIGKEIAAKITSDEIINLFDTGSRRAEFKLIDM
uniref:HAT C-terminal dimerisation domain-containing protein n=1 Tax=Aegilops tauschii subsp. strangulata TaxID=200361 RepID=A0A453AKG3_AEGTS